MKDPKHLTKIIGLTGGIGSGKSFVATRISSLFQTYFLHADEISRNQMKRGGCSYEAVLKEFGEEFLGENGEIDRSKLAGYVFSNKEALEKLNAITHPAVKEYINQKINELKYDSGYDIVLLESALMTEAGYNAICDEIWYVYASVQTRTERLMNNRNLTPEKIHYIMQSQADEVSFRQNATHIIDNDGYKEQDAIDQQILSFMV